MSRLIAGAILIASFAQTSLASEIPLGYLKYLDRLYEFSLADNKAQLRTPRLNAINELIDEFEIRYPSNQSLTIRRKRILCALSGDFSKQTIKSENTNRISK